MTHRKHISAASIVALAAFSLAVPVSAPAAGVGISVDASVEASTNAGSGTKQGADASAGTTADAAAKTGKITVGSVVSSLNASDDAMADVRASIVDTDNRTRFSIVTLADLKAGSKASARKVEKALTDQKSSIDAVRQAIEANAGLTAAMKAKGYTAGDVVGVAAKSDNDIMIVVEESA